jgi:hypothetical protein
VSGYGEYKLEIPETRNPKPDTWYLRTMQRNKTQRIFQADFLTIFITPDPTFCKKRGQGDLKLLNPAESPLFKRQCREQIKLQTISFTQYTHLYKPVDVFSDYLFWPVFQRLFPQQ